MDLGKIYINEVIYNKFLTIGFESLDAGAVADALTNDVANDVEETADTDNWNSCDVEIAIVRVLKQRLGIES